MSPFTSLVFIININIVLCSYSPFSPTDDYEIVQPKFYSSSKNRNKRSTQSNQTVIELSNWILEYETPSLHFADNFVIEYYEDEKTTLLKPDCKYLNGRIRGITSKSAVAICGTQLTGFINIGYDFYFVQPMNDSTEMHVLYNSDLIGRKRAKRDLGSVCYTSEFYNLTEDISEDDTLIELGDSSGDMSAVVEDGNGETDEIDEEEVVSYWKKEQIDPEEMGYFYDSAWETHILNKKKSKKISAPRRWLEIAIGADYSVIHFHGKNKVQRYILALMNIVSAIYQDPSLESNLQLVLTRMMLYEHKKYSQVKEGHARKSLENVNGWNKKLHSSLGPGEQRHDIAVWLTRLNMGGPSGYAPVAGTCDPARSCTLNRDEGLTSAFIIAHEMAHVLGLTHDGDTKANNSCVQEATDGSVMAPMVAATFNKFSWSSCSKKEFHKRASSWYCLKNPPPGKSEVTLKPTLHTTFSMDEQCRMEFGDGYKMCRTFDILEPCSHLWCGHRNSSLVCKTKKGPPLEGTECGVNKYCINGYCEFDTYGYQLDPVQHNPQDGGWSAWTKWGTCSKTCGFGVQFRSRFCNNPLPAYGGNYCKGEPEEFQICAKNSCASFEDAREEQCERLSSFFKIKDPLKRNMTWLPYESDKKIQKCHLICVSKQTGEILSTNENLIDGTKCSYDEENDICIQGLCYPLGCDGSFTKKVFEDSCGICGGNNSLCANVTSHFQRNIRKEISRIVVVPRLARNIKIECRLSTVRNNIYINSDTFLMIRDRLKGVRYNLTIASDKSSNTFIIRGAKFHYSKRGNLLKLWAKGPLLEEVIISLFVPPLSINSGIGMSISSSHSIRKEIIIQKTRFTWVLGGWGSCSVSCGGGRRIRTNACKDTTTGKLVPRRHCSLIKRPATIIGECNKFSCRFHWIPGNWEYCTSTCGSNGIQSRELYCVHYTITNNTNLKLWQYSVRPDQCSEDKPESLRPCNRVPCVAHWEALEWSQCSARCGIGVEKQDFHCPPPVNESFYTCGPKPSERSRKCRITGRHNSLCKIRNKKTCLKDKFDVCALTDYLSRYCVFRHFRKMCCKSCLQFRNNIQTM